MSRELVAVLSSGLILICMQASAVPPQADSSVAKRDQFGLDDGSPAAKTSSRNTANVVRDALHAFTGEQNPDGSWGDEGAKMLATAFVCMAFMGEGETAYTRKHGGPVGRARTWLLRASPTCTAERVAVALALAEHALLLERMGTNDAEAVERIGQLMKGFESVREDPWTDLLAMHLFPSGMPRPAWLRDVDDVHRKWAATPLDPRPTDVQGYLKLRLIGISRWQRMAIRTWEEFAGTVMPEISRRQSSGFLPSEREDEKYACTALAVQCLQVQYAFQPPFWQSVGPQKLHPLRALDL